MKLTVSWKETFLRFLETLVNKRMRTLIVGNKNCLRTFYVSIVIKYMK